MTRILFGKGFAGQNPAYRPARQIHFEPLLAATWAGLPADFIGLVHFSVSNPAANQMKEVLVMACFPEQRYREGRALEMVRSGYGSYLAVAINRAVRAIFPSPEMRRKSPLSQTKRDISFSTGSGTKLWPASTLNWKATGMHRCH